MRSPPITRPAAGGRPCGNALPEDARLPAGLLSDAELTDPLARGLKTIYPQQTRSHKV